MIFSLVFQRSVLVINSIILQQAFNLPILLSSRCAIAINLYFKLINEINNSNFNVVNFFIFIHSRHV